MATIIDFEIEELTQELTFEIDHLYITGLSGYAIEVDAPEKMDALLKEGNIGKIYKYTGVTTEVYNSGQHYTIGEVDE